MSRETKAAIRQLLRRMAMTKRRLRRIFAAQRAARMALDVVTNYAGTSSG